MSAPGSGWIGVDLDGTLAHYTEWKGLEHIGEPIWPMVYRIKLWLAEGYEVRIFTARATLVAADGSTVSIVEVCNTIWAWLAKLDLPPLMVTNVKDFAMIELWDDRSVSVLENTGYPSLGQNSRVIRGGLAI